jgi:hypothetical protein
MKKKVWSKPTLVVLVRSNPEEVILSVCKEDWAPSGPGTYVQACNFYDSDSICHVGDCYDLAPS